MPLLSYYACPKEKRLSESKIKEERFNLRRQKDESCGSRR
jgi:hypothetical protein